MNEVGGGAVPVLDDLRPIREDYAIAPILESFNWAECLGSVEGADWYLVAFRSVRNGDADDRLLPLADLPPEDLDRRMDLILTHDLGTESN